MTASKHVFSLFILFISTFGTAQNVEFNKTNLQVLKLATINVQDIQDKYLPHLEHIEAPHVSGNKYKEHLLTVKKEITAQYPKNNLKAVNSRSFVNPPDIISGYQITGIQTGSPIDNHLAMADKYIVTAGNFYMGITNNVGGTYKKFTLSAFANAAGVNSQPFDPRLAYDPIADRFILTFLAGFDSENTDIIIAFSETNDPRGKWNIYNITGNPNNLMEWTDYPMLALTNNDVFLTINLLRDDESWQEGFVETIIWQIDKNSGYEGTDLVIDKWDDITFEGKSLRNLCPAESATEILYDDIYFVSNRNFAVESDSFFLVHITDDATPMINVEMLKSNDTYGAPPNASQKTGELATNDARVLEAFRLVDKIQFVGNTRNLINNKAGIYHGIISDITNPSGVELNHIIGDNYEIGYPGITYTGDGFFEEDAIINFNHSSSNRFPGTSALYSIPGVGYSDIITLSEGDNYVDMASGSSERWGDYSGSQRDYSNPERVWVCGYFGASNRVNEPYVSELARPQIPTGSEDIKKTQPSKIFPVPVEERLNFEMNIPVGSNSIEINLYNVQGHFIDKVYSSSQLKSGDNEFSFNTTNLTNGTYVLKVFINGSSFSTHKFVK